MYANYNLQKKIAAVKIKFNADSFSWQLYSLQKVLCELELIPALQKREVRKIRTSQTASSEEGTKASQEAADNAAPPAEQRRLHLQGQFRYMEDWNAIIFLCNPL